MSRVPPLAVDISSIELGIQALQDRINQLQENLNQQQKLATLGMVTAVIAHEFNNILTPMISYTRYALSDKADQALKDKALVKALSAAERAATISGSLLGFARGGDGHCPDVKEAVAETLRCIARDFSRDSIVLDISIKPGLAVKMNTGHLQQVLMNLIVNARAAMLGRAGGIRRLTITGQLIEDGKFVRVEVQDTGPGIPADVLPRIFDPFFSTKKSEQPAQALPEDGALEDPIPKGGTGLGLTICHDLIVASGGQLTARSPSGGGATFTLTLPAVKAAALA